MDQKKPAIFALIASLVAGDTAGAKATAGQARDTLEPLGREQPDNSFLAQQLALTKAALGERRWR